MCSSTVINEQLDKRLTLMEIQMLSNGPDNPPKLPFLSPSNTWFLGHTRVNPKWPLDLFSRFCRVHERDQQTVTRRHKDTNRETDRQTDRPRYTLCAAIGRYR